MSVMPKGEYPVKWIPVSQLSVVWSQSQRTINERRVKQIVETFDPDLLGVLTVTLPNGNGIYHVIDGQHRREAIRRLWGDHEMVPCTVLQSKGPEGAAHVWLGVNGGRTKPGALESFRVGVTAGYEAETAVNKLLLKLGYRIGLGSEDGMISAVSTCMAIYRKHGAAILEAALRTIQGTWGKTRDSVQGDIITGHAVLIASFAKHVDHERLNQKIAKKYTPARFLGAARQAKDFQGGTLAAGALGVLLNTYNAGLAVEKRLVLDV